MDNYISLVWRDEPNRSFLVTDDAHERVFVYIDLKLDEFSKYYWKVVDDKSVLRISGFSRYLYTAKKEAKKALLELDCISLVYKK